MSNKKEFTGTYNLCQSCDSIYDFEDSCPHCGGDNITDISPKEIKTVIELLEIEQNNLKSMLIEHDDYDDKSLGIKDDSLYPINHQ